MKKVISPLRRDSHKWLALRFWQIRVPLSPAADGQVGGHAETCACACVCVSQTNKRSSLPIILSRTTQVSGIEFGK